METLWLLRISDEASTKINEELNRCHMICLVHLSWQVQVFMSELSNLVQPTILIMVFREKKLSAWVLGFFDALEQTVSFFGHRSAKNSRLPLLYSSCVRSWKYQNWVKMITISWADYKRGFWTKESIFKQKMFLKCLVPLAILTLAAGRKVHIQVRENVTQSCPNGLFAKRTRGPSFIFSSGFRCYRWEFTEDFHENAQNW